MCARFNVIFSELGAQIDGYSAPSATTVVVGSDKIIGRKADIILAAYFGVEAALKLIKLGVKVYI